MWYKRVRLKRSGLAWRSAFNSADEVPRSASLRRGLTHRGVSAPAPRHRDTGCYSQHHLLRHGGRRRVVAVAVRARRPPDPGVHQCTRLIHEDVDLHVSWVVLRSMPLSSVKTFENKKPQHRVGMPVNLRAELPFPRSTFWGKIGGEGPEPKSGGVLLSSPGEYRRRSPSSCPLSPKNRRARFRTRTVSELSK